MELSIKIQTQMTILKLIKLELKKEKKKEKEEEEEQSWPRWGGGHAVVGGEKGLSSSLCHPPMIFVCVRKRESKRESFLNALE